MAEIHYMQYSKFTSIPMDIEDEVDKKFSSSMWHTYKQLVNPFNPDIQCLLCEKKSIRRITANVWGVVTEADVCDEHSSTDGKCVESLD